MDLSHFLMSCNFFNSKFDLFYKRYSKLFSHYHLSDAQGIDSEGLQLGEGDLLKKNKAIFKKIIDNNKILLGIGFLNEEKTKLHPKLVLNAK